MDNSTYEIEAQIEEQHWWFVGRRKLFSSIIRALAIPATAKILDLGTSTGTNLRMLRDLGFTNVRGLDFCEEAIHWCREKGLGQVDQGDICDIPSQDNVYDLVLATDVIEHVEDDNKAISEAYRVLKPGGVAIVTVPAFSFLWGIQDSVSHHKRRYTRGQLENILTGAGFRLIDIYYFNYVLFIPIWFVRRALMFFPIRMKSENQLNTSFLNAILRYVFFVDIYTAKKINPRFGVSILALGIRD
ncbi:FIG01152107: hypothetical protein [Methylomonas albis]|uniref:Class I SAM-dependent methyltransferase n=1 Tax=Methylomonas albis TaxID=1854563 RepID=A0ABR9D0Q7_9GAMM|nr:class I SAM-dependent methyltransferase [Methylomonas albis]MBD9356718.1 class I SAM-dependent methyltransferase [Methylomonas albis]CAD6879863.1 FIG01152107: hypothetical protein [Methylomonas albis]